MSATKTTKKIWVSIPLVVLADATPESIAAFLENERKPLEVEVAAFVTKRLLDREQPFAVDFETAKVDRESVLSSIPRRLKRVLGIPEKRKALAEIDSALKESGLTVGDLVHPEECTSDNDPFLASLPL